MFWELGRLATHNLMRARARLAMTSGGVLVGTAAVVLLVAMTVGLQTAAEQGIGQSGALTEVIVGPSYEFNPNSDAEPPQLTPVMVERFWQIPGASVVIPMVNYQSWGELLADDYSGGGQIIGVDARLLPYMGLQAQSGSLSLEPGQVLIGSQIPINFYDPQATEYRPIEIDVMRTPLEMRTFNPRGDERRIDLNPVGVLAANPQYDYAIFMPVQQVIGLNEWLSGQRTDPRDFKYDMVIIRAESREVTTSISDAVKEMGFSAGGLGEFINQLNGFFTTMRLVLGGVGGVALLVAAFGVANTMTMAILERTREIGLMKAVGATDRDVLTVFLIEAALVGLVGGVLGVLVSYLAGEGINQGIANLAQQAAQSGQGGGPMFLPVDISQLGAGLVIIPSELALFALALATGVGIVAGLLPALRAARMTTVVALKTE
jgi:putative ABC transport system permease protein